MVYCCVRSIILIWTRTTPKIINTKYKILRGRTTCHRAPIDTTCCLLYFIYKYEVLNIRSKNICMSWWGLSPGRPLFCCKRNRLLFSSMIASEFLYYIEPLPYYQYHFIEIPPSLFYQFLKHDVSYWVTRVPCHANALKHGAPLGTPCLVVSSTSSRKVVLVFYFYWYWYTVLV